MKKVLFIVAAAIAATFSMTSCVETNESASVTALREAKAEQLRALAEAERTRAAADSILAAAQAAWYQAQAEYQQAQAAWQDVQTEEAAFELEKARALYEAELEAILLEAQNRLLEAQKDHNDKMNALLTQATDKLKELYRTYATEVNTLNSLKVQLNSANASLAQLENDLITTEEYVRSEVAILERDIASYEAQLSVWQNYSGTDKAELVAEQDRLYQEWYNSYNEYFLKVRIWNDAKNAYDEMVNTKYDINSIGTETHPVVKAIYKLHYDYNYPMYNTISYEYSDSRLEYETGFTLSADAYSLTESSILNQRAEFEQQISDYQDIIGKPASGSGASAVPATGIYASLADAQTRLAAAVTAKDEALIEQITIEIQRIEEELEKYNGYLADAQTDSEEFEELVKAATGEAHDAYIAEIEALKDNELTVAYFDASVEYLEASNLTNELVNQYNAISDYIQNYGILDVQDQIDGINSAIAQLKQQINSFESQVTTKEQALQAAKDNIADLTERIAIQEEIVALALQAIDDFIAANGTPEE